MEIRVSLNFKMDVDPEHWETTAEGKKVDKDNPIEVLKSVASHFDADFDQVMMALQSAETKPEVKVTLL